MTGSLYGTAKCWSQLIRTSVEITGLIQAGILIAVSLPLPIPAPPEHKTQGLFYKQGNRFHVGCMGKHIHNAGAGKTVTVSIDQDTGVAREGGGIT